MIIDLEDTLITEEWDSVNGTRQVKRPGVDKMLLYLSSMYEIYIISDYDLNNFTEKLNFHNKTTFCLHKGISKEQRQNALESFRNGKINILVSSDLSARGLDIKDITHVINLDFPKRADEYVHRVGRTARNGNSGIAISLVTTKELPTIKIYEKKFNIKINEKKLSYGKLI